MDGGGGGGGGVEGTIDKVSADLGAGDTTGGSTGIGFSAGSVAGVDFDAGDAGAGFGAGNAGIGFGAGNASGNVGAGNAGGGESDLPIISGIKSRGGECTSTMLCCVCTLPLASKVLSIEETLDLLL